MEFNAAALPGVFGVILKAAAAATALVSAICWALSARVEVPRASSDLTHQMTADGKVIDIAQAHYDQATWNKRAALAASASALCVVALSILDTAVNGYSV